MRGRIGTEKSSVHDRRSFLRSMNATTIWAAIAAVAATASVGLTAVYTWLTLRLLRMQAEPNVVVYVRHDRSRPTILEIVVKNIGNGLASDLAFKTLRPIPYRAFGINIADAKPSQTMTSGPLVNGIPLLAPGESRVITWGQFGGLQSALNGRPITITCTYSYRGRSMTPVHAVLEVESFDATDASETETSRAIKLLGKIPASIDNLRIAVEASRGRDETGDDDHGVES